MRSIGQQAARNNLKNGNPNETQDKLCCQRGYKINEGQALSLARGVSRGLQGDGTQCRGGRC